MNIKALFFGVFSTFVLIIVVGFTSFTLTIKVLDSVNNDSSFKGEMVFSNKVSNNQSYYNQFKFYSRL